ncbi:hypothetical protein [Sodalis-like endosymbiont of Proechinophthirus fluctus]|uniref:hypothetical protein n=1 Tax=Sodalis-like endosymbiont of Proechinophthirus fluctus TaxID=1462730 RepID=UPI0016508673|nr:hypothetical protein [Sodalis-like endosymbiont of Proechinophthirus fluctus]
MSKNSHILRLNENKLNLMFDEIKDAIKSYVNMDKAAHYKTLVNYGYPGIVVLSIANKHHTLTSSPAGM